MKIYWQSVTAPHRKYQICKTASVVLSLSWHWFLRVGKDVSRARQYKHFIRPDIEITLNVSRRHLYYITIRMSANQTRAFEDEWCVGVASAAAVGCVWKRDSAAHSDLIGYGRGVFIEITHRCRPRFKVALATSENFQLSAVTSVCLCERECVCVVPRQRNLYFQTKALFGLLAVVSA